MIASFVPVPTLLFSGAVLLGIFQIIVVVAALTIMRKSNRERRKFRGDLSETLEKIEVMTMQDRNELAHHYDRMLESLSNRLPAVVSAHAGDAIFSIEKRVLAKLAQLQPDLDSEDQEIDDLIRSMEKLEDLIIAATGDAVRSILLESREKIFSGDFEEDNEDPEELQRTLSQNLIERTKQAS